MVQGWSHGDDGGVRVLMFTKMLGFPLKKLIQKLILNEIKLTYTLLF